MKKEIKKIGILTTGIFFLLTGFNAFAEPITSLSSTNRIEYVYNPFGVSIASTDITTTVTTTKDETAGQTSTTTNTSIAKSIWKGGSLKVDAVNGTSNAISSDNKNNQKSEEDKRWGSVIEIDGKYYWPDASRGKPQAGMAYVQVLTLLDDAEITTYKTWKTGSLSDNAVSHTEFSTNYTYNDNGQLSGATGTSKTTGNRGKDSNGQKIGTYESTGVDNYIVKNGQALRASTVTTGTNFGADAKKTSGFTETTNYTNELMGGSWQATKETTVSDVKEVSGTTEKVTKTKTYTRDANGIATGITQAATGTRKVVNPNGGTSTFEIRDYKPEFKSDAKAGWYLAKESWTWLNT